MRSTAYAANKATVQSNQANVARLEQLQSYEKVYAPFDGIITARKTDIGALIDAGANAPKELFHIASITKLRVYVAVPEVYSVAARSGAPADLTLDEYPGETFHGTLVRNSRFDRSGLANLAGRSGCGERWWPSQAGCIRSGSFENAGGRAFAGGSCEYTAFPQRRFAGRCGARWKSRVGPCDARTRLWRQHGDTFRLATNRRCNSQSFGLADEWHGRPDQRFENGRSWRMKRLTLILLPFHN